LETQTDAVEVVRQRIQTEGPLRSADFEQSKRRGTWWDWKDEKLILEHLFNRGELMIARREKFQRVYDLQERVMPKWEDDGLPEAAFIRAELIKRSVRCLGVARAEWVADYYRLSKRGLPALLQGLAETGELVSVQVEGFDDPCYVHPDQQALLEMAANSQLQPTLTTLLSPFDPVVWDRSRARQLFGFDYSIECYLPAHKRKYGYFTLPILNCGRLVGRLDAKAHRSEKRFEVRTLHLEAGVEADERLLADLVEALRACAAWQGCPRVVVTASNPVEVAETLNRRF
jgi:uncharacterized protein YcaQ